LAGVGCSFKLMERAHHPGRTHQSSRLVCAATARTYTFLIAGSKAAVARLWIPSAGWGPRRTAVRSTCHDPPKRSENESKNPIGPSANETFTGSAVARLILFTCAAAAILSVGASRAQATEVGNRATSVWAFRLAIQPPSRPRHFSGAAMRWTSARVRRLGLRLVQGR